MLTAAAAMEEKITPVIIDNTNTQAWEMKPYLKLVNRAIYYFLSSFKFLNTLR